MMVEELASSLCTVVLVQLFGSECADIVVTVPIFIERAEIVEFVTNYDVEKSVGF